MNNPPGTKFASLREIKEAISIARAEALREASSSRLPVIKSRGTWLCTSNPREGQCCPYPEADCPTWKGTQRDIDEAMDLIARQYPDVTQLYIAGGYDGAESVVDLRDGNYEPWVGAWMVVIWERPTVQNSTQQPL